MASFSSSSPTIGTKGIPTLRYEGPRTITNNTPFRFKLVSDKLFHGQAGCTESVRITRKSVTAKHGFIKSGSLDGTFDPSGGDKSIWTWNWVCDTSVAPTQEQVSEAVAAGYNSIQLPMKLEFDYRCTEKIPKSLILGRPPTAAEEARSDDVVAEYPQTFVVDVYVDFYFSPNALMEGV